MKPLVALCLICFVASCSLKPTSEEAETGTSRNTSSHMSNHKTVFGHPHEHGPNCGHNTETVGSKTVYLHNGEKHFPHAGHVDLIH